MSGSLCVVLDFVGVHINTVIVRPLGCFVISQLNARKRGLFNVMGVDVEHEKPQSKFYTTSISSTKIQAGSKLRTIIL